MKYSNIVKILVCLIVLFSVVLTDSEIVESAYRELGSRVLSRGDEGSDVALLQDKLSSISIYKGEIDGIYGPGTEQAVKEFQRRNSLKTDGIAGSSTYDQLPEEDLLSRQDFSRNDIILLARVIHGEARGEDFRGKVAVGSVVINRVEHSDFPDNIREVVRQGGQFSSLLDGQANLYPKEESIDSARAALAGYDPTGGALYFYNPHVATNVRWISGRPVIKHIGNHVFAR
ncbi:MAG: cell wall hydrolase [Halanaerobiaceae bacterium]